MRYIEGADRYQKVLFPDSIDEYISPENPVRVIDAYISGLKLNELGIKGEPSNTGRPPYDPKDLLKLYVYGYFNRIRSSRRLEKETQRNIELMWMLNKLSPDHITIARFRKVNVKPLKNVFRDFVKLCVQLGLYGKELESVDGSKFKAVNSLENNFGHKKLDDRIKRIEEKLEQYLSELDEYDKAEAGQDESANPTHTKEEIASIIDDLTTRKQTYEGIKNHLDETGQPQISTTDPDAKRMNHRNGLSEVCYNVQTVVDDKHKLIAEFEVTNRCNDKNLLSPMMKSAKEILGVDEIAAVADTGYFTATDIAECINNGITPHISSEYDSITICIETAETEANEPQEFNNQGKNVFIKERNIGLCPMGCVLYPRGYSEARKAAVYANANACKNCRHQPKCVKYYKELEVQMPKAEFTKEYNVEGLHVKQITYTADKSLLRKRKTLSEHPFGTIKRHMDSAYCLMTGIENVRGEFALTFLAYNLKRVINILGVDKMLKVLAAS